MIYPLSVSSSSRICSLCQCRGSDDDQVCTLSIRSDAVTIIGIGDVVSPSLPNL